MDRREYTRIKMGTQGIFYFENQNKEIIEFIGTIEDISENGIKVKIDADAYNKVCNSIECDEILRFQTIDTSSDDEENKKIDVIQGKIRIVHKETVDNTLVVGCMLQGYNPDYVKYVNSKIVSLYFDKR